MYFPYFYGRRVELLALRDIADDLASWANVVPIIEPVKSDVGDLERCLGRLQTAGAHVYLVVNPSHGDFRAGGAAQWRQQVGSFVDDHGLVYPAHQVSSEADAAAIGDFLTEFDGRSVAIVIRSPHLAPQDLARLVEGRDAIVFVHSSANPRAYLRALPAAHTVEVESVFNVQERNADYSGSEWFTNSHLEFADAGRPGFSDFGPLPNTFSESGGPPGAVAIHLTFQAVDDSVWVQHFVSDSTAVGDGDVASKMAEATAKVAAAVDAEPGKFTQSTGLSSYLTQHENESPTQLASNKRQQLSHHLTTIAGAF